MLDFVGTIVITAVMVVNVNAVVSTLAVSRSWRLATALAAGLWIGLAAATASAGLFAGSQPFPIIGLFVALPLVAVAVIAAMSPAWRTALLSLPMPLLIALNTSRIFGALFLMLAADNRLSGPFPISAGWGDIITGALAVPALWLVLRRPHNGHFVMMAWNLFGAADLIAAIGLGIASAQGSSLQIFGGSIGSAAMQTLPWSLVPTVLVPFYLIVHGILFMQLRNAARAVGHDRLAAHVA